MEAWTLWTLASAVGGALGGATFITQFFGVLFLFGVVLGTAQALVLLRYLPLGLVIAGAWMGASFSGWLAGWMDAIAARMVLMTIVPETNGRLGNEVAGFTVWATFATFQGVALTLLIALILERRPLLALGLLWVVTGALGGALAVRVGSYLSDALVSGASGGSLGQILPVIVEQAAAGALYGAATGVVFAMIARRSAVQEDSIEG